MHSTRPSVVQEHSTDIYIGFHSLPQFGSTFFNFFTRGRRGGGTLIWQSTLDPIRGQSVSVRPCWFWSVTVSILSVKRSLHRAEQRRCEARRDASRRPWWWWYRWRWWRWWCWWWWWCILLSPIPAPTCQLLICRIKGIISGHCKPHHTLERPAGQVVATS